jgi:hypothetical protein
LAEDGTAAALADVLKNTPGTDAERVEVEREIGAG